MNLKQKIIGLGTILGVIIGISCLMQQEDFIMVDFVTQLAVALTLLIPVIAYWTFKPEINRLIGFIHEDERKRERHIKNINENIFKLLPHLFIREKYSGENYVAIPKEPRKQILDIMSLDDIEPYRDTELYSLETLPHPYGKWALEHLEKYPEINQSLENLKNFAKKITKDQAELKHMIDSKIESEMSKEFPDFVPRNSATREQTDVYDPFQIRKLITSHNTNIDHFEIHSWSYGSFSIMFRGGTSTTFLNSNNQEKLNLQKFGNVLTNISGDEQVKKSINSFLNMIEDSYAEEKKFKENMTRLFEELNTGDIRLKGTCEGCK